MTTVQPEEAIKFLENACRNWTRVPRLSKDDIADVCGALEAFAKHRSTSTEGLREALERVVEAYDDASNYDMLTAQLEEAVESARVALTGATSHVE